MDFAYSLSAVIVFEIMFSIKFSDAAAALEQVNGVVPLAEAHGCLVGALCAAHDYPFARWLDELLDESGAGGEEKIARDLLEDLYKDTLRAIRGDEMEFTPFLPEDDAPLAKRADALAQWCQGFLYGLGSVSGNSRPKLPADVEEILRDLTQLARATAGDTEPTEEDEEDYVEIIEYIRAGVQVVHDELRPTLQ